MKNIKKRYWCFVLYPESAPLDWVDRLQQTGLAIAISPLHNKDVNPDNTIKKEHYHIILCYEGPTTFTNVCKLTESLNQPIPQPLDSVRGYFRYFTHQDNPEKYQYDESLIKCLNGFNSLDYCDLTEREVLSICRVIVDLIRDNDITELKDLIDLLQDNYSYENSNLLTIAINKHNFFNAYIKSNKYKTLTKGR